MTDDQFLVQFTDALGADAGSVQLDTDLTSVELWDSVAYLAVMTMVDESMGVTISPDQLVGAPTPRAIYEIARAAS